MQNCRMRCLRTFLFCLLAAASGLPVWAAHGYALWGDLKYPAGFTHFDYVNPQAPKGGELRKPISTLIAAAFTATFRIGIILKAFQLSKKK